MNVAILWDQIVSDLLFNDENEFMEEWQHSGEIIKYFINDTYGHPFGHQELPLLRTIYSNWPRVLELFLKSGANTDVTTVNLLSEAIRLGNVDIIKTLLKYKTKFEITFCNYTIVEHDQYKHIISYLLANDIDERMMLLKLTPRSDYIGNVTKLMMFFQLEQIKMVASVFYDKPTYVIMWITNWLFTMKELTDYRKIRTIEGIKNSISRIKDGIILL